MRRKGVSKWTGNGTPDDPSQQEPMQDARFLCGVSHRLIDFGGSKKRKIGLFKVDGRCLLLVISSRLIVDSWQYCMLVKILSDGSLV